MRLHMTDKDVVSIGGRNRQVKILCMGGTLWVTSGDGRDLIVRQGAVVDLQGRGVIVVEALSDAVVALLPAEGVSSGGKVSPSSRVIGIRVPGWGYAWKR